MKGLIDKKTSLSTGAGPVNLVAKQGRLAPATGTAAFRALPRSVVYNTVPGTERFLFLFFGSEELRSNGLWYNTPYNYSTCSTVHVSI